MIEESTFNSGLLTFLDSSPTPFHATQNMAVALRAAGYIELLEADEWQLADNAAYFVTRNGSSIVAFTTGTQAVAASGWHMVGAHTDSPCLKLKPVPEKLSQGYLQLGVEVYGGALLNPWFDRDLGLAGRVSYRDKEGQLANTLININRPIGLVPSLAIHLNREANQNKSVNQQKELPVVILQSAKPQQFRELLATEMRENYAIEVDQVLDYDLCFYDCQAAAIVGWNQEFICSARLDNLLSCYVGLQALLSAEGAGHRVLVCNDHEEVGSQSAEGAQGTLLSSVLRRVAGDEVSWQRAISQSLMISADNAHGVHPNYAEMHDAHHGPKLNAGPVIKINANQRYASNSETSAYFRQLCEQLEEKVQCFVVRSDMACGSTIGPITASSLGVKTLDVGVPSFAMHSIRESAGSKDGAALARILSAFYQRSAD